MIYIVTLLVIFYGVLVYDLNDTKHGRDLYYFFVCLWLIIMSSIQYRMGADIPAYMGEYEQYSKNLSWSYLDSFSSRRPGWVLFNVICNFISKDFVFLKTVLSLFVHGIIFLFFKKYTKYIFSSLLIYFIVLYLQLSFNVLRASVAIALFLYAFRYIIEKRWVPYLIVTGVALLFHESALVFFVLPFFARINIKPKNLKLYVFIVVICSFLVLFLPNLSGEFASIVSSVGNSVISDRAGTYVEGDMYTEFHFTLFGFIENFLYIAIYLFFFWYAVKYDLVRKEFRGLYVFFLLINVFNGLFPILYRFNQFVQPFYIVIAADVIIHICKKAKSLRFIPLIGTFLILAFVHLHVLFIPSSYGELPIIQYYPYYTVFEGETFLPREILWGYKDARQLY